MIRFYLIIHLSLFLSLILSAQSKIYVDGRASSSDCMESIGTLDHPFITLQDALTAAIGQGETILVAQGTYYPDESECGNINTNDRDTTFSIPNGVVLMGGYNSTFTARDLTNTPSILSGDIDQNAPNIENNSFHVVRTYNVDFSTVIDGFIITGGNANASEGENSNGGGWYNEGNNDSSNPTIRNCRFISNFALTGGGMYNSTAFDVVSRNDFPATGVMYYQLETKTCVATKRMIVR